MIKISVILPVYNVGKYIEKCIKSLINQTLKDIEIIFVNDGSPDNSVDIIKKYQKEDKRIILINKENGGQGSARNLGLKNANGEYVIFVDSDDYVENNYLEELYNGITKNDYDIAMCNYYIVNDDEKKETIIYNEDRELTPLEYMITTPAPWNKLYKRSFLIENNGFFVEGMIYEDYELMTRLAIYNPKVYFVNKCLYCYYQTPVSTFRPDEYRVNFEDVFETSRMLYETFKESDLFEGMEYVISFHMLYLACLRFYEYKKYDQINRVSDFMHKYLPKWNKNRFLVSKMSKSQMFYMKLYYYKKYRLINIYRKLIKK